MVKTKPTGVGLYFFKPMQLAAAPAPAPAVGLPVIVLQHGAGLSASIYVLFQQHFHAVLVRSCRLGGTGSAGNPPYGPAPISGAAGGFGGERKPPIHHDADHPLVLSSAHPVCRDCNNGWRCQAGAARERLRGRPRVIQQPLASPGAAEGGSGDSRSISSILSGLQQAQQPQRRMLRTPLGCARASHHAHDQGLPDSPAFVAYVRSGGNGGGTPNANTTALCGVIIGFPMNQNIYCNAPAASAPAAGGTSFASGMAGSVAFQLGPQEFPFTPDPNGGFFFNQAQNGYVQVARVS